MLNICNDSEKVGKYCFYECYCLSLAFSDRIMGSFFFVWFCHTFEQSWDASFFICCFLFYCTCLFHTVVFVLHTVLVGIAFIYVSFVLLFCLLSVKVMSIQASYFLLISFPTFIIIFPRDMKWYTLFHYCPNEEPIVNLLTYYPCSVFQSCPDLFPLSIPFHLIFWFYLLLTCSSSVWKMKRRDHQPWKQSWFGSQTSYLTCQKWNKIWSRWLPFWLLTPQWSPLP